MLVKRGERMIFEMACASEDMRWLTKNEHGRA